MASSSSVLLPAKAMKRGLGGRGDQTKNMNPGLKVVYDKYTQLEQEWRKQPQNLAKCGNYLSELKVALTQTTFLPTNNTEPTKEELTLARSILEIGAFWSIESSDIAAFERYMAQLKCYYLDYNALYKDPMMDSSQMYTLLGLNLLCLLSQNRVAEFHTELELLPPQKIQEDPYIRHSVCIEQYLMEGSYNKIFLSKENVPHKGYKFFMEILINTIRDERANCLEKAYESLLIGDATTMLFLAGKVAFDAYAEQRGWKVNNDKKVIFFNNEPKKCDDHIMSRELAEQAIEYARELEMIV